MPGRPPDARVGEIGAVAGRPIIAGVAPFARAISPRASDSDLWAAVQVAVSGRYGLDRMEKTHGTSLDKQAREKISAFVNQARQYYGALAGLGAVAKPLVGYYFALNLTKALLTVLDPSTTRDSRMTHGLSQAYESGTRYSFKREKFRVRDRGAFRLLAENTGMKHCWAGGYELSLHEIMPFLADGYSLYADANEDAPKLLPIDEVSVLFGRSRQAWLRVEIDRNVLRQRNLSPERVLEAARVFGDRFRLVTSERPTASYESVAVFPYGKKRSEVLSSICAEYDASLIACDRSFSGGRRYLVLSERATLLSHEALTFAVLHHLSNLVRYRPADGERLLGSTRAWLFTSWVERACESYLLNIGSRITREEHLLV